MDQALQSKSVSEMSDIEKKRELERIQLIQRTVAVGTTKDELLMFLYHAKKTGLDPLARQIYIIVRGKGENRKATIQASIDGLRLVAERSGNYAGQDAPDFEILDGEMKCTVRVYKFDSNGVRYCHSTGVAYKSEYMPPSPNDFMWKTKPHIMLAKVAEALALRKAFPQDLSGIYSEEEMGGTDAKIIRTIDTVSTEVVTKEKPDPIETAPPAEPVEKSEEQKVLDGDTVLDAPTAPPAPVGGIQHWQRQVEVATTDDELQEIELAFSGTDPSPLLKSTVEQLIKSRRQKLADSAFGA